MPVRKVVAPSAHEVRISRAYGRMQLAARPTRSEVKERVALNNIAFRAQQWARTAKPRLVRPAQLHAIPLEQFLAAQPVRDVVSVSLADAPVRTFDKRQEVAEAL